MKNRKFNLDERTKKILFVALAVLCVIGFEIFWFVGWPLVNEAKHPPIDRINTEKYRINLHSELSGSEYSVDYIKESGTIENQSYSCYAKKVGAAFVEIYIILDNEVDTVYRSLDNGDSCEPLSDYTLDPEFFPEHWTYKNLTETYFSDVDIEYIGQRTDLVSFSGSFCNYQQYECTKNNSKHVIKVISDSIVSSIIRVETNYSASLFSIYQEPLYNMQEHVEKLISELG